MVKRTLILLFLASSFVLAGEEKMLPVISNMKLKYYYSVAPNFRSGSSGSLSGSDFLDHKEYMIFDISYVPGGVPASKKNKTGNARNMENAWLDDVRMDILVAYPEVSGKTREDSICGLFSGTTKFWSIPLDGKRHNAIMCIPPHLIARYTNIRHHSDVRRAKNRRNEKADSRPGAVVKKVRPTTKEFYVEVIFTGSNGYELGRVYSNYVPGCKNDREKSAYFKRLKARVGSKLIKGAVYPKNESPWAFVETEKFDLIKPGFAEPAAGSEE